MHSQIYNKLTEPAGQIQSAHCLLCPAAVTSFQAYACKQRHNSLASRRAHSFPKCCNCDVARQRRLHLDPSATSLSYALDQDETLSYSYRSEPEQIVSGKGCFLLEPAAPAYHIQVQLKPGRGSERPNGHGRTEPSQRERFQDLSAGMATFWHSSLRPRSLTGIH